MKFKKICICAAMAAIMMATVSCGKKEIVSDEGRGPGQESMMPGNAYMKSVMDIIEKVAPGSEIELITGSGGAGDILNFNVKTTDEKVYIVGIAPDGTPAYVKDGETEEYLWME